MYLAQYCSSSKYGILFKIDIVEQSLSGLYMPPIGLIIARRLSRLRIRMALRMSGDQSWHPCRASDLGRNSEDRSRSPRALRAGPSCRFERYDHWEYSSGGFSSRSYLGSCS